jgi:hypothetical protein
MMGKVKLTAAVLGLTALAMGQVPAQAEPVRLPGLSVIAPSHRADGGLLLKADWDGSRCWRWRHECADRWGWRTHRFFVCLRRHDC